MNNRKYLRIGLMILGVFLLGYFGYKALNLMLNPPQPPSISDGIEAAAIADLEADFAREHGRWNNQFAQKGFFSLVGLFLLLLGALPKKKVWIPKILFSAGLVALIINHLLADGKIGDIMDEGISLSIFWILMAFVVKGTGMWCTVWRWKVLLEGQGFKIPLPHLVQSFLIGRFIGSFAPGTSGLDGYRAYDISRYTGKVARSLAVIFVEKLIGFLVLGTLLLAAIPIGKSLFDSKEVNTTSLVMMGLVFMGMMLASMIVLFKPGLIRWVASRLFPVKSPIRKKVDKAVKAVSAYENRKFHLVKAVAIGFGVHLCTAGMYFCTARAIVEVGGEAFVPPATSDLFATAALMIGATVLPLSIAGIGMREGVFAFFLGPIAAIYAFGGYLVGEVISLFGGPVWLARKTDYYEVMKAQRDDINRDVEDDEEEEEEEVGEAEEPAGPLPSLKGYGLTGLAAGLMAGLGVALFDSARLWIVGQSVDWSLPGYGGLLYGPFLALLGAAAGVALAILGRLVRKPAARPIETATFLGFSLFGIFSLPIGFFYLQRDLFGESVGLFTPRMMGAVLGLVAALLVFGLAMGWALRRFFSGDRERFCKPVVALIAFALIQGALVGMWLLAGRDAGGEPLAEAPGEERPNIVLVMNDTHRADHVGAYGGPEDLTPNLDGLARDGVVFENAFAQASWTRPSVCTILTGRYPSSHTATQKGSVLPDEITTLAEVMLQGGYETIGIATNYNLTPFFNVDQGFHDYRYLTPNLPFGSTDEQAKLIFVEVAKKIQTKFAGKQERPEDYYVTGDVVSEMALERLDLRDEDRPFFMFLSYMDVHDPYFRHPFDGYGISHRANPNPDPEDEELVSEMKELYAGEVRYWDEQFGKLVDGLKKRGLYDETMILVVSDHGEEFGEHGGFWHGTTLYDEQLKIVFIAKYPDGEYAGTKLQHWVRLLDVAPVLIDAAHLDVPEEMQGTATPTAADRTPVYSEEDHQGNVLTSIRYEDDGSELKMIRANKGNPRGLEPLELYRVDSDPAEKANVVDDDSGVTDKAVKALDAAEAAAAKGAAKAQSDDLSDEQKKVLEQLGYMKEGE